MSDSNVVAGPRPGSSRAAALPARAVTPPRPIPHRYRVGTHGPVVLMDCRECRTPWAPDVEVPRDRLCRNCRRDADEATPALFEIGGT
ncbi:hypothetical protein ACFXG4_27330 [Nocardia sp. NPDC059246]|uniref:hypothetical protein n=1 Tax=unclassified Nocardia TaxID=2637762 RepID=UPI0036BA08CF